MISGTILPPIGTSQNPAARTPCGLQQGLEPKSFKKSIQTLTLSPNGIGNITRLAARPNFFGGNRATNLNSSCLVIADDPKSPKKPAGLQGVMRML
jgi:hypothetical protein